MPHRAVQVAFVAHVSWEKTMRKTFFYVLGGQLATISIPVVAQEYASDAVREGTRGTIEQGLDMFPTKQAPDAEPVEPARAPEPDGR